MLRTIEAAILVYPWDYKICLKIIKFMIDFKDTVCYDVIGKESRVSTLTRHN